MVSLKDVRASNTQIKSAFPSGLVAVFVGATSGIGAYALKEFAHQAAKPRIYFVGRSQEAANKILVELKTLNPGGEYIFLPCDTSLLRNVDELCLKIKAKETGINVLFMSQGTLKFTGTTTEGLPYFAALTYYGRIRFASNLLPLLRSASGGLRRVVSVFAGTYEGPIFPDDWACTNVPMSKSRGHMVSMITLAHLKLRESAPEVSFVQNYPGGVKTGLIRGDEGFAMQVSKYVFPLLLRLGVIPRVSEEECGERQAYNCTSGMYPSDAGGEVNGVPRVETVKVAPGVDGKKGSGVYSNFWDGECGMRETERYVREHTEAGLGHKLWEHTTGEFVRITGKTAV